GSQMGSSYTREALIEFIKIIVTGFSVGFTSAYAFTLALKNKLIPHYLLNAVVLALVLGVFVLSDLFAHESGLLSVVIMGMVLGNMKLDALKDIFYFKETISILLISILFILLSANIDMSDLELIFNWKTLILFAIVVLIIRPLGVFLSSMNSTLKQNEKIFISWVGPRGIVAAGIASLFGIKLTMQGYEDANFITPLVFMVVLGTVLLNATTARMVAKITRVLLTKSEGILIVGASEPSRLIASYLIQNDRRVVLIDSNPKHIQVAKDMNLEAIECDIFADDLLEDIELNDIGYLLALTGSTTINNYAMAKFSPYFGEEGAFKLLSAKEMKDIESIDPSTIFSYNNDFINLSEVVRDYPNFNEVEINSKAEFKKLMKAANSQKETIPLFLRDNLGEIHILGAKPEEMNIESGNKLMYLGKKITSV
ncbi:MAG: cation:proton antiporter, partial [Lutimonas sp.]